MNEIKNCPFCGDAGRVAFDDDPCYHGSGGRYFVVCAKCNARANSSSDEESAIALWNKRANIAQKKRKKIEDIIPEKFLRDISKRKIAEINQAIKQNIPVLFLGGINTGKTYSVNLLRNEGIAVFEINNAIHVDLETKEVKRYG